MNTDLRGTVWTSYDGTRVVRVLGEFMFNDQRTLVVQNTFTNYKWRVSFLNFRMEYWTWPEPT